MLAGMLFTGPYRVPHLAWAARRVYTNTCGKAAYRGPWMMETTAREQMLDVVAREIGIDPLELRRRNVIHRAELPYTSPGGKLIDNVSPEETLEQAAAAIDYDAFRAEQAGALAEGRLLGIGVARLRGAADRLRPVRQRARAHPHRTPTAASTCTSRRARTARAWRRRPRSSPPSSSACTSTT